MKVVIVCESMFGNTEVLAGAVAGGLLREGAEVQQVDVNAVRPEDLRGCDVLVVAAPTHALSLSRPESRAEAVSKGADPRRAGTGVREWLRDLPNALPDDGSRPLVAVFDTRVLGAKHWPGSAASRAARTLRRAGFVVVDRASFYVDGVTGPLSRGQVQAALLWGTGLPDRLAQHSASASGRSRSA